MNKKTITLLTILIITVVFLGVKVLADNKEVKSAPVLSSAIQEATEPRKESKPLTQEKVVADKIEVVHFHSTHQCWSCITVGEYALTTIKEKFPEEFASGKIVYKDMGNI